jgi:hypothetical protein
VLLYDVSYIIPQRANQVLYDDIHVFKIHICCGTSWDFIQSKYVKWSSALAVHEDDTWAKSTLVQELKNIINVNYVTFIPISVKRENDQGQLLPFLIICFTLQPTDFQAFIEFTFLQQQLRPLDCDKTR